MDGLFPADDVHAQLIWGITHEDDEQARTAKLDYFERKTENSPAEWRLALVALWDSYQNYLNEYDELEYEPPF